ncbi:MAG: exodeoxyribonuclease VII small subunit [Pseudomonadota bacterium]
MLRRMDEGNGSRVEQTSQASADISQLSFEQALGALETIVQQLERGDVPLDESIALYERGEKLREACQKRLDAAQARIEKIVTNRDGAATGTEPLDPDQ